MMQRTAHFDPTGHYRYSLERVWDATQPAIAIVMLNPSQADQHQDDPTLRRCLRFATRWQCGRLIVVNLFAYCTASPQVLKTMPEPVGINNDAFILQAAQQVPRLVLAWGNHGGWQARDLAVLQLLAPWCDRLYHLGLTRRGQPCHPLYLPTATEPVPWKLKMKGNDHD
jgi:hypothetical protein